MPSWVYCHEAFGIVKVPCGLLKTAPEQSTDSKKLKVCDSSVPHVNLKDLRQMGKAIGYERLG